jgi:prolipoprotein diacylglyceryl transferase
VRQYIPTPSVSTLDLGSLTIHLYALCILLGIIAAISFGTYLYREVGGSHETVTDVAIWAIPAGIVGGRLYHLITSPQKYFGSGSKPFDSLKIWEGGMGIWGAIALGSLAAFLVFKKEVRSTDFGTFADAIAPGLLLAQAIGRWGNWFNGELFGRPTQLPWALEVPLVSRPLGYESYSTFQPTFLYESIWCLICAILLILLRKKLLRAKPTLRSGSIFLAYVALYCLGRLGIELLRIDEANHIFGLRVNVWVSCVGFLISAWLFTKRLLRTR